MAIGSPVSKKITTTIATVSLAAVGLMAGTTGAAADSSCVSNMCAWYDSHLKGDRGAWDTRSSAWVGEYWNDEISSINNRSLRHMNFYVNINYGGSYLIADPGEVINNFTDYAYYDGDYHTYNDKTSSFNS